MPLLHIEDYLQEPAFPKDRQISSSPSATWGDCIHTVLKQSALIAAFLPGNVCTSFSMWMCRRHWNGQFLVVCWIGISPLRNPWISLSCSDCAHSSAHRPITLSLADGSSRLQISISKQNQICSNLWILFYFILQFVEELLKWLAGPPITSGDMPRQALPSSSWQVRYYVWWMCGNYTSTVRSSPYSAFSTLPPHPSVTLMGDKFKFTFCLSSYHFKYNENKAENKDRSKIKDTRAGRKNGK